MIKKTFLFCMLLWGFIPEGVAQPRLTGSGLGNQKAPSRSDQQKEPGIDDLLTSLGRLGTEKLRSVLGVENSEETKWDSNKSPRHTLFTFINGMDAILRKGGTKYESVEKTLPQGYTYDHPNVLALKEVLDRFAPLNPVNFPDTPATDKTSFHSFEVFPYAVEHEWIWNHVEDPPDEKVVLEKDQNGEGWVFSRETLENAPALLKAVHAVPPVYPSEYHQDLLRTIFQPMAEDTPWWGWGVMTLSLVLAFYSFWKVKDLFEKLGNHLELKTRPVVGSIIRSIGASVGIIVGTLLFIIGGSFVHFTQIFANIYWQMIQGIMLIAFLWVFLGITDLISTLIKSRVLLRNDEYRVMSITIIHRVVNTALYTLMIIYILENVFGMNISALIAGLGIIGLAVSLAGKESAQNLFGAISIFANRPFVVGDWVKFKGDLGIVEDVRMQATHIQLLSGEVLIVPNMQFVSNEVENLSMRKYLRREMNISLPYGTAPEKIDKALSILKELLKKDEIVKEGNFNLEEREASVTFSDFGDYYLNIRVYYWYFIGERGNTLQRNAERGWYTYLEHCTLVNRAIVKAFEENGIEFAFPTQTLELINSKKEKAQETS